jgi:sugar phosphate permease
MPHLRWIIIGLVFLATLINYLDRLTISVLAPVITKELHLSNLQFAWLGTVFLLAYTISQAVSGRLLDRLGTKRGFTFSVTIWSLAAMATAAARSLSSLSVCRFVLGFGEAGNWPGAAKVVAEWFPQRERAFAMAIFNSGAALGAVIGPPVIVFLQLRYGWQTTFLVTGALGFLWLLLWLAIYEVPARHRWLQPAERRLIEAGQEVEVHAASVSWLTLLTYREVWAIVLARVLCDPTWWLYITWLPKYLSDVRGFTLAEIGLYAWVPYLAADAGSLLGGAASGLLIAHGWSVHTARRAVILASAALMPIGALAVRVDDAMTALVLMSIVLFAFQAWINNVQVIPSDLFPPQLVASVAGLGGFGAGIGSMIFTLTTGWIVDHFSYTAVFTIAALLAPLATMVLITVMGSRETRVRVGLASLVVAIGLFGCDAAQAQTQAQTQTPPTLDTLLQHSVRVKPELEGIHPRVFVTKAEIEQLRTRAKTTHRELWQRVLTNLAAMKGEPPPAPGPQERRAQNNVAYAISEISLAYAVEQKPEYLAAARRWLLAAIGYEPWGYTFNKPNVDLAAGHLLYAIGWAYDLLYHDLTDAERVRIRASLERHARLVADYFSPNGSTKRKRFAFTQNHDFIPTAGLGIAALALMGESADAPKWAALARAHQHRAGSLLSPDGYYYEGMEYWIFSSPWLVHFLDAWEHTTGESLWEQGPFKNWKYYVAHAMLPDGQNVFDFGDVWEGPLTRAGKGEEYDRVFPGGNGKLQSNCNVLYRVARRLNDPETQAVAMRLASFGHSNLEEYWSLIWYDPSLEAAPMTALPTFHHFEDSGVVFWRSNWDASATAFAVKDGPPEGHRALAMLPKVPEWEPSNGHAHPDVASFIIFADGKYLTGDTGYAGVPLTRQHNTITIDNVGQGREGKTHEVWDGADNKRLDAIRVTRAELTAKGATITVDAAGAYDAARGLTRFTRTLTFTAPGAFHILDDIATEKPATVQWYLHSDNPFTGHDRAWRSVPMEVAIAAPALAAGARVVAQPTQLKVPGRPGSITEGTVDQRGYELMVESAAALQHTFDVHLTLPFPSTPSISRADAVMPRMAFATRDARCAVLWQNPARPPLSPTRGLDVAGAAIRVPSPLSYSEVLAARDRDARVGDWGERGVCQSAARPGAAAARCLASRGARRRHGSERARRSGVHLAAGVRRVGARAGCARRCLRIRGEWEHDRDCRSGWPRCAAAHRGDRRRLLPVARRPARARAAAARRYAGGGRARGDRGDRLPPLAA